MMEFDSPGLLFKKKKKKRKFLHCRGSQAEDRSWGYTNKSGPSLRWPLVTGGYHIVRKRESDHEC